MQSKHDYASANNGLPLDKTISLYDFRNRPAGVEYAQWALLGNFKGETLQTALDNGITRRTLRRVWRAGVARFV